MAEDAKTEEEPSIEEILDSIRQIISEDEEDSSADEEEVASTTEDEDSFDGIAVSEDKELAEEPLDQSAIDDIDFDSIPAATIDEAESDDIDTSTESSDDFDALEDTPDAEEEIIELTERVEEEVIVDEVETDELAPIAQANSDSESSDNLLTQNAENAAVSALTHLVKKTAVEYNGVTLEEIVRTELRPHLQAWLDKHLPTIIERLVQEELERVSKRVLED